MVLSLHLPDRFVRSGAPFAFEVSLRELRHLWPATKRALLEQATLLFPGFRTEERTIYANGEFMGLCGSVVGPGFHPIEMRISVQGQTCVARDYVTVLPEEGRASTAFPHYGYYVFLTRKGFTDEAPKLAFWGAEEWQRLIDWMAAHGMGQVWFTMNCFYLAYASRRYPELVDASCANVRKPFLNAVIAHAHRKGIQVHMAFTSDDYATGLAGLHPEVRCLDRGGSPYNPTACCLEIPRVRQYILGVVSEAVEMHPEVDGIVVHANENGVERYNPETQAAFRRDRGEDFIAAAEEVRQSWYAEQASRLIGEMHAAARSRNPRATCIAFQVPWIDAYAEVFTRHLPAEAKVCVWHYLHHGTALENRRLHTWMQHVPPERLLFMPNGFSYRYPSDPDAQWLRHVGNDCLLSVAHALGYGGCIYYVHHDLAREDDRLRDLTMAQYPALSLAPGAKGMMDDLHHDYFGTRARMDAQ